MTKAEILKFINANPDSCIATIEGNKPRVRGITIYKADEKGIIIQTWTLKDFHKQLQKNPEVEMCFSCTKNGMEQVRISGQLELVDDLALKQQVVKDRSFMKAVVDSKGYEVVAMYRLKNGKGFYWTPRENFSPKTYIDL
jgi:pyridoxamine 5'-phosphate oxidase